MKICSNCVLDEKFPGIKFNEHGVCNFCLAHFEKTDIDKQRAELNSRFKELINQLKKSEGYDCVLAYSGGKDSTYVLHTLKNSYNLNVLAYSYDNWFQSERAQKNIKLVLKNLSIDHLTILPSFETIRNLTVHTVELNNIATKALTRASAVCTSCISLIRLVGLRLALEWHAPFFVMGLSPGQSSLSTAIVKMNGQLLQTSQAMFLNHVSSEMIPKIKPLILEDRHFDLQNFPYSINPLAFEEYDENKIMEIIKDYGWEKPDDTDANSTNCLLNTFANQVHKEQFGFNPYASEIAELVRTRRLSREEGLKRLQEDSQMQLVNSIKKELGLIEG